MIRGTVALPSRTGKSIRVAVFAQGEASTAALEACADPAGVDALASHVESGMFDLELAIATPDIMPTVHNLAPTLGPPPPPPTGTPTPQSAPARHGHLASAAHLLAPPSGLDRGHFRHLEEPQSRNKSHVRAVVRRPRKSPAFFPENRVTTTEPAGWVSSAPRPA